MNADRNELRANIWYEPQEFFNIAVSDKEILKCLEIIYVNNMYYRSDGYGKLFFLAKDSTTRRLCWINEFGKQIDEYHSETLNTIFHRGLQNKTIENESCESYKHFKCYLNNPFPKELLV